MASTRQNLDARALREIDVGYENGSENAANCQIRHPRDMGIQNEMIQSCDP